MRAALIAAIALGILGCQGPPPPVMATIPVFSLTSAQGETFKSDALVGQPYVASFFFTSCQTICPVVMNGVRGTLSKADAAGIPFCEPLHGIFAEVCKRRRCRIHVA